MHEINRITVSEKIGRNDIVVKNILNLGVDLISTSNVLKHENN